MKKALLKLLALSLALTFVMGVLSGCGDTAEKDSDGDVVKLALLPTLPVTKPMWARQQSLPWRTT